MLREETTALGQRNRMRQDLADIRQAAARDSDEIVPNAQQPFPLDLHVGLEEEIEVFDYRTGKRVLDGNDRGTDLAILYQLENLCRVGTGNNGCLRLHL